jgi:hypothetical protein
MGGPPGPGSPQNLTNWEPRRSQTVGIARPLDVQLAGRGRWSCDAHAFLIVRGDAEPYARNHHGLGHTGKLIAVPPQPDG